MKISNIQLFAAFLWLVVGVLHAMAGRIGIPMLAAGCVVTHILLARSYREEGR